MQRKKTGQTIQLNRELITYKQRPKTTHKKQQNKQKPVHETHRSTRHIDINHTTHLSCVYFFEMSCAVHDIHTRARARGPWIYGVIITNASNDLQWHQNWKPNWHIANMLLPNSTEYTNLIKCWTTSIQNRFKGKTLYRLVALSEIRQKKQLRSFDLSFELMFFEGTLMEQMDEMKNVLAQLLCNFTSNNNNMSLAVGQVFYAIFRNVVAISRQQLKRYWMRLVSFNLIDYAELLCSQLTQIRVEEYIRYEAEQRKKNQWI